jgi:predicted amidohydrolase
MKPMPSFKVATCQFPVTANIERNSDQMQRMIAAAAEQGANVVHFPEAALSGYAGAHFQSWDGFDWDVLLAESDRMRNLARQHSAWILFGSAHRLSEDHLPHNSVYVLDPGGNVVERYDKLFCTKNDLKLYSPGTHFAVFQIEGIKCGILVCHDIRYPELNREYYRRGVRCIFYSFYNAGAQGRTIHTTIMHPTQQARAATNHMWLSVSNASGYYQGWSSAFIVPDGRLKARLRRHRPGMMINTVDTEEQFPDKCSFKDLAVEGIIHSGEAVDDPRSDLRNEF